MIPLIANGAALGLTAGLSPGPLMTLIVAESLRGGWSAGFRISFAPLVTDTVLITLAFFLTAALPPWGLSVIGIVGGLFIMWMGWGTIRSAGTVGAATAPAPRFDGNPLARGIMTNLLNPYAFLFWATFGVTILRDAYTLSGWTGPVWFMAPFFVVMISVNLVLSYSVARGRHLLGGAGHMWTLRIVGGVLMGLGMSRVWAGLG